MKFKKAKPRLVEYSDGGYCLNAPEGHHFCRVECWRNKRHIGLSLEADDDC